MYEELEPLANLRIGRAIDRIAKERSQKLAQTARDYEARGLSHSGLFEQAKLTLTLDSAKEICHEVASTWRELIARKDGRLSQDAVRFIISKVEQVAHSQATSIRGAWQTAAVFAPPGLPNRQTQFALLSGSANREIEAAMGSTLGGIRRDLEIELREQALSPTPAATSSREAFVIMASDEELQGLYVEAVAPAIRENGLDPFLMVHREPEASIVNEILSRIDAAALVIADLTLERPNCYFEVGYAQAKGKRVIFTARKDHDPRRSGRQATDPKVHFDLDSHRLSFWEARDWPTLRAKLSDRIREALSSIQATAAITERLGERGENAVLQFFREAQSGIPGSVVLYDHFIAQALGWPTDETQLVLKRLVEKGRIEPRAGGYSLRNR